MEKKTYIKIFIFLLLLTGIILAIVLPITAIKLKSLNKEIFNIRSKFFPNNTFGKKNIHTKYPYRLSDMVRMEKMRQAEGLPGETMTQHYFKKYPNSIATKYMKMIKTLPKTKQNNNIELLKKIINEQKYQKYHNHNTNIVIHIRTGDVIDQQKYSVDEFLSKKRQYETKKWKGNFYVKPLSYYKSLLEKIDQLGLDKNIILVTGFHKKDDHSKSLQYIDKIQKFFEKNGYLVTTRINRDPDEDFVFISTSKYYIPSGGGFSLLLSSMVVSLGGMVILEKNPEYNRKKHRDRNIKEFDNFEISNNMSIQNDDYINTLLQH